MKRMQWVAVVGAAVVGSMSVAAPGAAPARFADVPQGYWAQKAIATVAARGVMPPKTRGAFKPEQTVTRAELAAILVRLIDSIEGQGPQKLSRSPSKPHVPRAQRTALARLPHSHRAYPALARLIQGGYLVPDIHGGTFLPTKQNLDQPVTREELAQALAGISIRITEKRVALEHPESLKEGYHLGPNDERPTVPRNQPPHRHEPGERHGGPQPPRS
jgi:S-layer homology domain